MGGLVCDVHHRAQRWVTHMKLHEESYFGHELGTDRDLEERERERERERDQDSEPDAGDGGLRDSLRRYEVKLILKALEATGGNQTKAARILKVPLRTLAHKMKMLGIRKRGYEAG
jgi:DNA-binding NtrC family response regulator